ncbi:MAG: SDR family NAD(P)-dependent oxidoreductase [Pseudomonadales bacterium]
MQQPRVKCGQNSITDATWFAYEVCMSPLSNQIAIITGASHPKGMGFAIAKKLLDQGASVVVTDLPHAMDDLQARVVELESQGGRALAYAVDVTRSEDIQACVQEALSTFGRIDILVNNAGIGGGSSDFLDVSAKDFELAFNINVLGVAQLCQAVIPTMLKQESGVIVNVASLCGLGAIPDIPASYTASKFAAVGLAKAISLSYADKGIRCNTVCPGVVNTQMRDQLLERLAEQYDISIEEAERMENETIAMKRGAEPEEIAEAVSYLAGPSAKYITGVALPVAGGMAAGL